MVKNIFDIFREENINGANITVIYDAYSSAWQFLFLFMKKTIEKGYFPMVSNYSVPLGGFFRRGKGVGLDVRKALEEDKMAIIDVFGSRYTDAKEDIPNVYYLDKVEPETINPKIDMIYSTHLGDKFSYGKTLRVIHTLDGAALMLGEEVTLRLLNQTIATKSVVSPNSVLLLPINSDMVSRRFTAWVSNLSDYVLLAKSWIREDHIKELLYLLKAPYPDFEPTVYKMSVGKGRGIELEGISSPELRPPAEEQR